jgi:pSer/pThr/pTyr-binding forkhead associated (FHA) protein
MPPTLPLPAPDHTATCLETDEDVMQALRANDLLSGKAPALQPAEPIPGRPIPLGSQPSANAASGSAEALNARSSAKLYRPTKRPPIAVLTVFDDGKTEGEEYRLRAGRFIIGRTEGHLKLAHDAQVSSKHVEISRRNVGGEQRWVIADLKSTNGLYARVSRTALPDQSEFRVGQGQYRVLCPSRGGSTTADYVPAEANHGATQPLGGDGVVAASLPTLVELFKCEAIGQITLSRPEYWIGTDPVCLVGRPNDPFCEPRHARLFCDGQGAWNVENNMSLNGVWLRVPSLVATSTVQFQIGEQLFRLQVGG